MCLSKNELFDYLISGIDKSGYLKTEKGFSKTYPNEYNEIILFINKYQNLSNLPFKQKLWHYLKNISTIPVCKICGKPVNFSKVWKDGYYTYCSSKCVAIDCDTKEKINETCIKKYGVKNYNLSEEFKEKSKMTNLNKYGCEYYTQSDDYKAKTHETNLEKYCVDFFFQSNKFKEEYKKSCKDKYGVDHYTKTSECMNKMKHTNLERYGVESYSKTNEYKEKVKKTNIERYGVENPFQLEENKEKIIKTNLSKYGKKSYTQTEEYKMKSYIAKKKNKSFNTSKIEEELSNYLSTNNIPFLRQYKTSLYPFSCDFYLIDYNMYIEIQGTWTHGEHPFDKNNKYDIDKLNKWKSKKSKYYNNAIKIWTDKDPQKRKIAKNNKLNYLEIFSTDLNKCVDEINKKIKELE